MESKGDAWESGRIQHAAEKRLAVGGRSSAHLTVNHNGDEEIGPIRVEGEIRPMRFEDLNNGS